MESIEQYIDGLKKETKTDFQRLQKIFTFQEFLKYTMENPNLAIRTSYQYLNDAIKFYGVSQIKDCGETIPTYGIFKDPFNNGTNQIFGAQRALHNIVDEIRSSAMEEGKERMIMIHGPPGTAKTAIVDLLAEGLKRYSTTDGGAIFRFFWEFDANHILLKKPSHKIGFAKREQKNSFSSQSEPIRSPCHLNENPLYLIIDKEKRQALLEEIVSNYNQEFNKNIFVPKKILEGNLCYNCKQIYEHLLREYNGNLDKVLSHIKVERFVLDDNRGFAVIDKLASNENYQKIRIVAKDISEIFPNIDLISMFNHYQAANRGLLQLSDVFKSFNYSSILNDIVEKHRINMGNVKIDIDEVLIGTTNPEEHQDVEEHKYSEALMQRIKRIDVGYLLNINDEKKIYERDLTHVKSRGKHIAPHTIQVVAMWAVLSRYTKPLLRSSLDLNVKQQSFLLNIQPLEKMEIYMGKKKYEFDYISGQKIQFISDQFRKELRNATDYFSRSGFPNFKEGYFGVSPREVQDIFKRIIKGNDCLNPLNVLRLIDRIYKEERKDFTHLRKQKVLRMSLKKANKISDIGNYYSSFYALRLVKRYYQDIITKEVKYSLLFYEEDEVDKIVKDYIQAIFDHAETLSNNKHKFKKENLSFVENLCMLTTKENIDIFRQHWVNQLNEYYNFNKEAEDYQDYRRSLPNLYTIIENSLFKTQASKIDFKKLKYGLNNYGKDSFEEVGDEVKEQLTRALKKLKDKYGYCDVCSKVITNYVLKEELLDLKDDSDDELGEQITLDDLLDEFID
ncbi:MAG: hypothetical protein U9Q69_04585 [Nanoarchaeota archaeon]|nr:hypothetical protein [Nanoarchaeota archaeon]